MKVFINHTAVDATGVDNLEALLEREGLARPGTAVAVANKVVRREDRSAMPLEDGMAITVIKAVCGG